MYLKLQPAGSNRYTAVTPDGHTVFFSYETPVAALIQGQLFKTDTKFSATTNRHIKEWLDGRQAEVRPQAFFEALANGEPLEPEQPAVHTCTASVGGIVVLLQEPDGVGLGDSDAFLDELNQDEDFKYVDAPHVVLINKVIPLVFEVPEGVTDLNAWAARKKQEATLVWERHAVAY